MKRRMPAAQKCCPVVQCYKTFWPQAGGTTPSQSVQLLSRVQLFATPWTAAHQASLSITNSWSLLKLMSIKSVMPSNQLILCRPLQSFPASGSFPVLPIRWPNYCSFSFSISPSNEQSGLISFGIDCFDLPAVLGTLKNILEHHSLKGSVLWH